MKCVLVKFFNGTCFFVNVSTINFCHVRQTRSTVWMRKYPMQISCCVALIFCHLSLLGLILILLILFIFYQAVSGNSCVQVAGHKQRGFSELWKNVSFRLRQRMNTALMTDLNISVSSGLDKLQRKWQQLQLKKIKNKITYNGTLFHIIFFFFKDGHMHILNSSFQNHSTWSTGPNIF